SFVIVRCVTLRDPTSFTSLSQQQVRLSSGHEEVRGSLLGYAPTICLREIVKACKSKICNHCCDRSVVMTHGHANLIVGIMRCPVYRLLRSRCSADIAHSDR